MLGWLLLLVGTTLASGLRNETAQAGAGVCDPAKEVPVCKPVQKLPDPKTCEPARKVPACDPVKKQPPKLVKTCDPVKKDPPAKTVKTCDPAKEQCAAHSPHGPVSHALQLLHDIFGHRVAKEEYVAPKYLEVPPASATPAPPPPKAPSTSTSSRT
jgi:hypothetical protein